MRIILNYDIFKKESVGTCNSHNKIRARVSDCKVSCNQRKSLRLSVKQRLKVEGSACKTAENYILVQRGHAPFGQHQESRLLGRPNTGSLTNFLSLCACSESSLTKSDWLRARKFSVHVKKIGPGQKSRFLMLTKRSAASGDNNDSRK